MNFSAIFIRRPVATTLLTIGMTLAGVVAFRFLPVSPLPQVDFPTISVSAALPGADPETMATSVAAPLERQLGSYCRGCRDDFEQFPGLDVHRPPIRPGPQYRWRRTRRAGCNQRGAKLPAHHAAEQSNLSQSQSGGCTDPHPGAYFPHCEQGADVRCGLDDTFSEALSGGGDWPGFRGRRFFARGPCGIGSRTD